ncbi:MAG TPA: hypothetical protein EYH05_04035 [Anaerolineae bacterium]|nr:hypothetical protein [Anaerolineae bacterium]
MTNITLTEVGDSLATIVAAQALGYLKANTVLTQLVARNWENEIAMYGQTVKIPFTGSLSVNDKAANTVVTLQNPNDTAVSVTLDKHKEVSFLIEDTARAMARPDYLTAYITDSMAKVAEQIDSDLAALYTGFSQTIDATAGLTEATFREARRQLNAAKATLGDRVAVLHEDAEYELLAIDRFVNRDYAELQGAPQGLLNAYTGRFMGFDVYMDQQIPVVTGTPNQAKNLFFQRNAIVLATRPLPQASAGTGVAQIVMNEDGIGLRVTLSYSPNHLGMQATIDVLYGVNELRDNHGVVVSTTEI